MGEQGQSRPVGDAPPVFILIHGTFAREAAWTKEDAALALSLKRRYGDARFRQFLWTGKNSHEARLSAGRDLDAFILEVRKEFPASPIFLIGHSHGGNVILYGLRRREVADQVTGVLCMATPFIKTGARDLSSLFSFLGWAVPLQIAFWMSLVPAMLIVLILEIFAPENESALVGFIAILLGSGVGAGSFGASRKFVLTKGRRWAERKQMEVFRSLTAPKVTVPIVSASVRRDEAGAWLRLGARLGELPHRGWRATFPVFKGILITWFAMLILVSLWDLATDSQAGRGLYMMFSLYILLPILVLLGCLVPLMALLPWAVRGNPWVFGGEGILYNFLVVIEAERSPPSASESQHIEVDLNSGQGLRHSRLYSDETILAQLTEFFDTMLAGRGGAVARSATFHNNSFNHAVR